MKRTRLEAPRVLPGYTDNSGQWVQASEESVNAVEEALFAVRPDAKRMPIVLHPGERLPFFRRFGVTMEDGTTRSIRWRIPESFPLGYHQLDFGSHSRRLIVAPRSAVFSLAKDVGVGGAAVCGTLPFELGNGRPVRPPSHHHMGG